MDQPKSVLDASALLAWLHGEPGTLLVRAALDDKAVMSVVNWAEVLSKLADLGQSVDHTSVTLSRAGILGQALLLWPLDEEMAVEIARLRSKTKSRGLSLGDRACIALAQHLGLPILTADRAWKKLPLGVPVHVIR